MSGLSLPYDLPDAMSTAFEPRPDRNPLARRRVRDEVAMECYDALPGVDVRRLCERAARLYGSGVAVAYDGQTIRIIPLDTQTNDC